MKPSVPLKFLIPLALFIALAVMFYIGLGKDPRKLPSPLIDKPAPAFAAPQLADASKQVAHTDFKGDVWLFNVWASWCASCRVEHPLLNELAKQNIVKIVGLNYKDKRDDAQAWLTRFGNPYAVSVHDLDGRIGINYGVYGAPETFLIDKTGVVRWKHIGPLSPDAIEKELIPLVKQLSSR
jgi:cytochrome c biogenesis protein CcmG, thiol:disulfide interchange protein DsbE